MGFVLARRPPHGGTVVSALEIVGLLLTVVLGIYLFVALLLPESFQ
jgi:K+-transporting ATPase KdpF subunit